MSNAIDESIIEIYSRVFDRILWLADFEDANEPLKVKIMVRNGLGYPVKDGLLDPYNLAT